MNLKCENCGIWSNDRPLKDMYSDNDRCLMFTICACCNHTSIWRTDAPVFINISTNEFYDSDFVPQEAVVFRGAELKTIYLGLYEIYWKEGGFSLCSVSQDSYGNRFVSICNWISGCVSLDSIKNQIKFMRLLHK